MDDDYQFDDEPCPKCGHSPTHARRCTQMGCDDGWIDMHEYDDPLWYNPGEQEMCRECWGTGWERWCPKCGFDLQAAEWRAKNEDGTSTPVREQTGGEGLPPSSQGGGG